MATPLVSKHDIMRACSLPGPSTIKVKNLHATIQGPQDAWGRQDRPQPIAISAAVSLQEHFGTSSASDTVATDTVHYGLLSKAILSTLASPTPVKSLRHLLDTTWVAMTGVDSRGQPINKAGAQQDELAHLPFLHFAQLRSLEITLHLPKATLLGDGVSVTGMGGFAAAKNSSDMSMKSSMAQSAVSLKIQGLQVPTLIGVNSNERLAKQVVIASVEIEKLEDDADLYPELEQVIVKASLQAPPCRFFIASNIIISRSNKSPSPAITTHLRLKHTPPRDGLGWDIEISLEKPVAVPLADAACVEMRTNTNNMP
ncbi:hypothetical protein NQ176_g6210 [Zarea fungicola]|uniref:Uncharacterized protein n=1 Tax=Zarea fungicola TaxID=93591 RepID=A0ACC1N5H4_9HYPO|nr:hypothetical protein NQ176_g6210 [Lecanicillium fungicola]